MAGHSKWSTVKRIKGAIDVKRGQLFSKLSKEIAVAARLDGGDPLSGGDSLKNPRLRAAVLAARAQCVPADNVDRAIMRASGGGEGASHYKVAEHYLFITQRDHRYADSQKLTYLPDKTVPAYDETIAAQLPRMCDAPEDDDDVQGVKRKL